MNSLQLPQTNSLQLLTSPTQKSAALNPTIMKVHYESDNGAVASHAIKYNQTSTAADVTSYVIRKMQLPPAAYELIFRSLDGSADDGDIFNCKNDTLLLDAVASCSGSRGKWWVRLHQPSHSDYKTENEWLRKEVAMAAERLNESFERERTLEIRLREVVEHAEVLAAQLHQHQISKESIMLWSKQKSFSIGAIVEKAHANGARLQVRAWRRIH